MFSYKPLAIALWVAFTLPGLVFAHGGDGEDHTNAAGLAQMPDSLSDTSGGGGGGFGTITSAKPSITKLGREGGSGAAAGAPSSEVNEIAGPSGPPPLSQPGRVAAGVVRDVPPPPGTETGFRAMNHESLYQPRSEGSFKVYEAGYNTDLKMLDAWRKSLTR